MKKTLILLTGILLFSCNQKNKTKSETTESKTDLNSRIEIDENFDWLTGKWRRMNEETGKETFENWNKVSPTEYSGIGFTMQNGDTVKQEKIIIVRQNGKWDLIVKVPQETESITFKIAELKNDQFTCINDSLDFPKQIKYWKTGEKINALVAGDSLKIEFEFERIE
ncbi:MAG: hypothetical protein ABFR32_08575 [Bacteroidota bacterium]